VRAAAKSIRMFASRTGRGEGEPLAAAKRRCEPVPNLAAEPAAKPAVAAEPVQQSGRSAKPA